MDSYGVANPNTNNSGFQPNLRLAYSTDGAAVYRPPIPPPPYQDGGNGSSVAPPPYVDGGVSQIKKKRGRPRKYSVEGGGNISPLPPQQVEAVYQSSGGRDGFPVAAAADGEGPIQESKKQRGRPRKSAVEGGSMQLEAVYRSSGLSSPSGTPMPLEAVYQASGLSSPSTPAIMPCSSGKSARGRPKGAKGKKQQQFASMGSAAVELTPHVITVHAGEDICAKIISVYENRTRGICVLSANGAVSNATLSQAATSGGTITYEGRFDIIRLNGSFVLLESGSQRSRTAGGLSVVLTGPDGHVFGGNVVGVLIAAAPVQIVVSCFTSCLEDSQSPTQAGPSTAPPNPVPGASAAGSPISWGTMSDSSGGPGSPLNQGTGAYDNSNQPEMSSLSWLN